MSSVNRSDTESDRPRNRHWLWCLPVVPGLVCGLFFFQPDRLAALTVLPRECWFLLGCLIQGTSVRYWRIGAWQGGAILWLVFLVLFVEPPMSVARSLVPLAGENQGERPIVVVTLNCAEGGARVLSDLKQQAPDLVLLQESPSRETLQYWTDQLFGESGDFVHGSDCSVLARGRLTPVEAPADAAYTHAIWEPREGKRVQVFSLRLWPQPMRLDFWSPVCWQAYSAVRNRQTAQMNALEHAIRDAGFPVIVGGDFNTPAGDRTEWALRHIPLEDAFGSSGRGWGKTIVNGFPFHRIDRIWHTPQITPVNVTAIKTVGSDHRLVRCELLSF